MADRVDEILAAQMHVLGEQHHDTLDTMEIKAMCLREGGKLDEALELHLRCLEFTKKVLGHKDPDFSRTVHNLGFLYNIRGEHNKALEYFMQSLDLIRKYQPGAEKHRETLYTIGYIGEIYDTLGQYEKALEFFHLAQRGSEETLGLANISTMTLASNLAIVYCRLRRFEDALKWGLHCVEVCKGLYGLLHKYTLHEVSNVIEIYGKLGMVEEALQLARDLVDGYVGCMGRTIRTHRRR